MKEYLLSLRKRKHPVHANGKRVTQADLSRTVRQILVDTMLGKPAPPSLNLSQDGTAHTNERGDLVDDQDIDKLHALRVTDDKFDAFNKVREARERVQKRNDYIKNKINDEKKKIKDAQAQAQKKMKEELDQLREQNNTKQQ